MKDIVKLIVCGTLIVVGVESWLDIPQINLPWVCGLVLFLASWITALETAARIGERRLGRK